MEAKKENNFDKYYIQPLKRGCSGLNRTKLIFCKHALIKTKCGERGAGQRGLELRSPRFLLHTKDKTLRAPKHTLFALHRILGDVA